MIRSSHALASALLLLGFAGSTSALPPHGGVPVPPAPPPSIHAPPGPGVYKGPGDTGNAGTAPSPAGPSAPSGPSSPPSGSAAGPGAITGSAFGAGAMTGQESPADSSHWAIWWGFNKAPYLELKRAIHSGHLVTGDESLADAGARAIYRPSPDHVRTRVVPALEAVLATERSNDLVSSATVALARIAAGDHDLCERLRPRFLRLLRSSNQEIAETAAVALGVLGDEGSTETLRSLLQDEPAGRTLVGSDGVSDRTRAFAAYGLGLVGQRATVERTRFAIARVLTDLLRAGAGTGLDVEVAALIALGELPLPVAPADEAESSLAWTSRQGELRFVLEVLGDLNRRNLLRAHAPTVIARLCAGVPSELRLEVHKRLCELVRERSKESNEVQQSAVQALGALGDCDRDRWDTDTRAQLKRLASSGDEQVRAFALVALGRISGRPGDGEGSGTGAPDCRAFLTGELARGRSRIRAWSARALGGGERAALDAKREGSAEVRETLRTALAAKNGPEELSALAIALGLARYPEAQDPLLAKLAATNDDATRGYLGVALGMIGVAEAVPAIEKIVRESRYRPALLREAATGLGLLGDKTLVPELTRELGLAQSQASQASIAQALGAIGDERALEPLLVLLQDPKVTDSARGFAAVALGLVCDPEPLPWVSRYSLDLNYRASTSTLLGGNGTGLLEIL
jgi:HEAT repeat protein